MRAALLGGIAVLGACTSDTPARAGAPFTVWVLEERLTFDGEEPPVAGARVALDPAAGERVVRTTDADGHVTFEGDLASGGASVTVLADDHVYVTMLEASPETARARPNESGKPPSDLVILTPRLDRLADGRTAGLRGSIAGKEDPANVVAIAASGLARLGTFEAGDPAYALRVPKGQPFFLLGHETNADSRVVKSFRFDLSARSGESDLDLDLGTLPALPSRAIHVETSGAGVRAFAVITSTDSGLTVGIFGASRPGADGRFGLDGTLVETDIAPERLVSEAVLVAPDGSESARAEQGAIADGTVWSDFLAPPSIPDPDASRTIRDPIPLDGFPAGADLLARVYAGGQLVWILHGPPGGPRSKTFAVPYRDEIPSADVQVFALSLSARRDRLVPHGAHYRHSATFRDVQLRKR